MKAQNDNPAKSRKAPATLRALGQRLSGVAICTMLMVFVSNVIPQGLPLPKAQPQVVRGTKISDSNPAGSLPPPSTPAQESLTNAPISNITTSATTPDRMTKDGFVETGFDSLSGFPLMLSNHIWDTTRSLSVLTVAGEIPKAVKSLDKRRVVVKGFMLPVKLEAGRVTEFMLLKNQMVCCFGGMPQINDWVYVRMGERGVNTCMDQPLTIYGTLHVGQFQHPNGVQFGIYQLDGEKLELRENSQ